MEKHFNRRYQEGDAITLYGRRAFALSLKSAIEGKSIPENIALLGIKGYGKSLTMKYLFSPEERKRYCREKKIIVTEVKMFDNNDNMMNFFGHLTAAVFNSLDELLKDDYPEIYNEINNQSIAAKNKIIARSIQFDNAAAQSHLEAVINIVRTHGFIIYAVIDDFETMAESSNLKKAQYKFMRDLANTGRMPMFIATNQDLTRVSDEIKGSGFEGIFDIKPLTGINFNGIEDWAFDLYDEMGVEFDDDYLDWIEDISGGIPKLVADAGDIIYDEMLNSAEISLEKCAEKLYRQEYGLLNEWWNAADSDEQEILEQAANNEETADTSHRDCLIKKGYIFIGDSGKAVFITPLLSRFILENPRKKVNTAAEVQVTEMVKEVKEAIDSMGQRIDGISNTLEIILNGMPNKNNYLTEDGTLDCDKFRDDISNYISDKLNDVNYDDICAKWKISDDVWNSFSDIRKSDCSMAYRLLELVFVKDIPGLDYSPVTVMMGNLLEGLLNDYVAPKLKIYVPNVIVKTKNGTQKPICQVNDSLTIGAFSYLFKYSNAVSSLSSVVSDDASELDESLLNIFKDKLSDCHRIRNKADHPGDITDYLDKKQFVSHMFTSNKNLIDIMWKINTQI